MHAQRSSVSSEKGYALIYMCVVLAVLLIFTGLAVDTGRAYVVKAQLTKAVDGAALAAARNLNSGNPKGEAATDLQGQLPRRLPRAPRPSTDPTQRPELLHVGGRSDDRRQHRHRERDGGPADHVHEARELQRGQRRGDRARRPGAWLTSRWSSTCRARSAGSGRRCATRSRTFVGAFDKNNDRDLAADLRQRRLGARRHAVDARLRQGQGDQRRAEQPARRQHEHGRGAVSRVGRTPLGSERPAVGPSRHRALHRRRVEQRAGQLRCGSRSRPGAPHLRLPEECSPDPDGQTWDNPQITGLYDTSSGAASPSVGVTASNWNNTCAVTGSCVPTVPYLPLTSFHALSPQLGYPDLVPAADQLAQG